MTTHAYTSGTARPIDVRREQPVGEGVFVMLFGVVLPMAALALELATRACASGIFDPMPTPLHVALVASVPLGNLLVLLATRTASPKHVRLLGVLNGVVMGVALCYSIA